MWEKGVAIWFLLWVIAGYLLLQCSDDPLGVLTCTACEAVPSPARAAVPACGECTTCDAYTKQKCRCGASWQLSAMGGVLALAVLSIFSFHGGVALDISVDFRPALLAGGVVCLASAWFQAPDAVAELATGTFLFTGAWPDMTAQVEGLAVGGVLLLLAYMSFGLRLEEKESGDADF